MAFAPPPDAPSPLARYRILSPNAAVRVSPLCLGAMNLGTHWAAMMGGVDKEASFELLDYFYEQGGNFIDVTYMTLRDQANSRLPMATRMNKAKLGSVNGLQNVEIVLRSCLLLNSLPLTNQVGRIIPFMRITVAILLRVLKFPLRTV